MSDYGPDWAASEKYNAFKLLVVKEVVEGPQAAFLTEGVRVKVWVVATNITMAVSKYMYRTHLIGRNDFLTHHTPVDVTALQAYLLIHFIPQFWR